MHYLVVFTVMREQTHMKWKFCSFRGCIMCIMIYVSSHAMNEIFIEILRHGVRVFWRTIITYLVNS